ncbi:hypothetical protein tb265_20210 [Gemmatimonadetes bacterium T265]|nr:hypothetical protein tb265_20210 [Gemmatimonadetes bacterium T265]
MIDPPARGGWLVFLTPDGDPMDPEYRAAYTPDLPAVGPTAVGYYYATGATIDEAEAKARARFRAHRSRGEGDGEGSARARKPRRPA